MEGSHKPTEAVLQAFVQERPETWAQQLPIARWAWNTTAKRSLNGMSPYQVVTGLVPRNPLASRLQRGTSSEWVSPVEYVNDLKKAMEDIYEEVKQAQERRAEETTARGEQGRIPRQLEVGEHVLLRRRQLLLLLLLRLLLPLLLLHCSNCYYNYTALSFAAPASWTVK